MIGTLAHPPITPAPTHPHTLGLLQEINIKSMGGIKCGARS